MNYKPAFWLGCGCLIALAGLTVTEIVLGGFGEAQTVSGLIDLLKYVAATALGFFFATVCNKKDKE